MLRLVQNERLEVGDTVRAGQVVARLGNNGKCNLSASSRRCNARQSSRAMKGEIPTAGVVPLQVRFDLAAMGRLGGFAR
jgi:hypothetical protein